MIEVLGARIDFPEDEYAYEIKSTGIQDYHRVCRGVHLVEEGLNQREIERMKCAL